MKKTRANFGQILLLVLALSAATLYLYSPGTGDMLTQQSWLNGANDIGLRSFYLSWIDYPPGALTSFFIADLIFPGGSFLAIKFLILLSLLSTALLIGLWSRDINSATITIFVFFLGSMGLGYIDIVFAPFLVAALWALSKRNGILFGTFFALACFIKWQPLILLPFAVIYILGSENLVPLKQRFIQLFQIAISISLISAIAMAMFTQAAVSESFTRAFNLPYFTGNALNFDWILTWINNGATGPISWTYLNEVPSWMPLISKIIMWSLLSLVIVMFLFSKRLFTDFLVSAMAGYFIYSAWNINVHENHMFVPALLAVCLLWAYPRFKYEALIVIALFEINMIGLYGTTGSQQIGLRLLKGIDLTLPIALIFCVSSIYTAYRVAEIQKIGFTHRKASQFLRVMAFGNK